VRIQEPEVVLSGLENTIAATVGLDSSAPRQLYRIQVGNHKSAR
jgi:hypothetical protein